MPSQSKSRSRKRIHAARLCCEHGHVTGHYGAPRIAGLPTHEKVSFALEAMERRLAIGVMTRSASIAIPFYRAWLAGYSQAVAA